MKNTFLIKNDLTLNWLSKECGATWSELIELGQNFEPTSSFPYLNEKSFRMTESWRSVCIPLDNDYHLIVKGSEVFANDLSECYRLIFKKTFEVGSPSNASHFYFKEGKIPLLLTAEEALAEFNVSKAMVDDYLIRFQNIPSLPIPLCVLSNNVSENENPSFHQFRREIRNDLGIEINRLSFGRLVYLYKGRPARVKTWLTQSESPKLPRSEWVTAQAKHFDGEELLKLYAKLFLELSDLGWILTPVGQDHQGFTLKAQNLTLGGGFVDLGNAYKIGAELTQFDKQSFLFSFKVLAEALSVLFVPKGRMKQDLTELLILNQLVREMEKTWRTLNSNSPLYELFQNYFSRTLGPLSIILNELMSDDLSEDLQVVF